MAARHKGSPTNHRKFTNKEWAADEQFVTLGGHCQATMLGMGHGSRVRAAAAWSSAGVAVLMTTGYLLLVLTAPPNPNVTAVMVTADVVYGVVPALLGAVVASRVRSNSVGWVLIGISLAVTSALGNE